MKFLTDRKEIGTTININEIPVIRVNIAKQMQGYDDCYEGDKVVVVHKDGSKTRCTVQMFSDGENESLHATPWLYKKIELMPESICICEGFGYSDVVKDYEWSRAHRIEEGQKVVIMFDHGDACFLRVMTLGHPTKWVSPTASFKDVEEA